MLRPTFLARLIFPVLAFLALSVAPVAKADNVDGAWSSLESWPLIALHAVITPDGRVLSYGTNGDGKQTGYFIYDVWDPSAGLSGGHMTLNNLTLTDIFCSSQVILPQSGEILIAGGDNWNGVRTTNTGNSNTTIFDYGDNTLAASLGMHRPRWYSSATVLVNGEVYIQGGSGGRDLPEVRLLSGGFRLLTDAPTDNYNQIFPRNFLAPDGRVFGYDINGKMYFVDPAASGSLSTASQFSSPYAGWQSSAAMYRPGRILQIGSNSNGVIDIDIRGPVPIVTPTASTSTQRRWVSATVLPNGKVLATGGSEIANELTGVNNNAEIWDPDTGAWHVGAPGAVARLYHSSALLLPDASVLVAGGGAPGPLNNLNAEIYYPPYLFDADGLATRPQIVSAPDTANVGDGLTVEVDTSSISRVTLVKTGSVTHSVNMDQRFLELPFTASGNMLYADLPTKAGDTPPGYYFLFAIDDAGVPSVAHMLRINIDPTPDTAVDFTPAIGGAGGYAFELACNVDEILVGVHGKYATFVNQLGAQCVKVDQFGQWIDTPTDRPVTGNSTAGTSFSMTCPAGFAMSGFQGNTDEHIDQLDIECRALTPTGGLTGAGQFLGAVGGPGGDAEGPYSCGTGNPVYALYGRSSMQVDSVGAKCRPGVITPISTGPEPIVVNPGTQSGIVGVPLDLQINASDGDDDELTFSASGLPTGLSIDTGTGLISGIPTIDGTSSVQVSVTDGTTFDTADFDWIIDAAPSLFVEPMPVQPPIEVDTPISYTAITSGGSNVVYKWDFGDGTPETSYSASPSITHTFSNPEPGPGVYYVTLTVNDDAGIPYNQTFVQRVHLPLTTNKPGRSTNIEYEERSVGNSRFWVVNQDNDTVTAFDAVTNAKLIEVVVGDAPRAIAFAPDGRAWITNKSSNDISVIDTNTFTVVQNIPMPYGSQPYGIVFSPVANESYVVLQAGQKLLKLDATSGSQLGSLDTGPNPRHLAISADGTSVYVSRFITPPQPGEDTVSVESQIGGQNTGGEILVVDSASMTQTDIIVLQHSLEPDFQEQGRGVPNYIGALAISPDGTSGRAPAKKDNIMRGSARDGLPLSFQNTVRSISLSVNLLTNTENFGKRIDYDNASLASAAVFDPFGMYAFVALETSREIAVIDAYADAELFRVGVGMAPIGLAMSPDGMRLYVSNLMDRDIHVLDLTALQTTGQWSIDNVGILPAVSNEKLTPEVFLGKQLFYDAFDPRLALDRYMSCATCHSEGGGDGRVWDLTHLGEGLRNTISLNGRALNHGRRHWTGNFDEVQDFEGQIRVLAAGTGLMDNADFNSGTRSLPLGDPKAGISPDLDALAAYVNSLIEFDDSPYRNNDGSITSDAMAGRVIFENENCATCHFGPETTDSNSESLHDAGTLSVASGSRLGQPLVDPSTGLTNPGMGLDTPTLLDVWATAPYLHDGSARTLADAIQAHGNVSVAEPELSQLVAYLQQFDRAELILTLGTKVGGYLEDWTDTGVLPTGWSFLWNQGSVLGDETGYAPLLWDGVSRYDSDGVPGQPDGTDMWYGHFREFGIHPGRGVLDGQPTDRYAIARYTVPSDGIYYLANSTATYLTSCGNGVEVVVLANNTPLARRIVSGEGTTGSFDTSIGSLSAGDTVDVAIGPNGDDGCDSSTVDWDILLGPTTSNSDASVTITSPSQTTNWNVGDSVAYTGIATDSVGGDLSSEITWTAEIIDGSSSIAYGVGTGSAGTITYPGHAEGAYLRICASVDDGSGGTAASDCLDLIPAAMNITGGSTIGGYQDDWVSGSTPPAGWIYMWNASGALGDSLSYAPLVWDGVSKYDSDGVPGLPDGSDMAYGHFREFGVHPGRGQEQGQEDDRYAIARYTVASTGDYFLINSVASHFGSCGNGNGVEIFVLVNDTVFAKKVVYGSSEDFNASLGSLAPGDTIDVAIGPRGGDGCDGAAIDWELFASPDTSNSAPSVNISLPTGVEAWAVGDIITYSGTAEDVEDGSLAASLVWTADIIQGATPVSYHSGSGANGQVTFPDQGDGAYLQLCALVTDSGGLTGESCVNLPPAEVNYSFDTVPSGLTLEYNGTPLVAPFSVTTTVGASRQIAATSQGTYVFGSWTIGGPAAQQLVIESTNQTVTATFLDDIPIGGIPVANYQDDWTGTAIPPTNWAYLWNENGPLGDPIGYTALLWDGISQYDSDGSPGVPDDSGMAHGRFSFNFAHAGRGTEQGQAYDRYAIARYTVSTSGNHYLVDSWLTHAGACGNGVEVVVLVNDTPVLNQLIVAATDTIDSSLGSLAPGDTIDVAIGPNGRSNCDGVTLNWDLVVLPDGPNTAPSVSIATPSQTIDWEVGDPVAYSGNAIDAESGDLSSTMIWTAEIVDASSVISYHNETGPNGNTIYPGHAEGAYLRLCASATDDGGLTGSDCIDLLPAPTDTSGALLIAGYQSDWTGTAVPSTGWAYLWNENGPLGDPTAYTALLWDGISQYDSDGVPGVPDATGMAHGRFRSDFAHAGRGTDQGQSEDRYAIARYSVQSAGRYYLVNSWLTHAGACGDGVEAVVQLNDKPILSRLVSSTTTGIDASLGYLMPGDTIDVAIGPDGRSNCDGVRLNWDFVAVP